ncbi:hypothetical protein H696_05929 [Fonticula alba]|uniref:Uncharacterized protein n=1 Tax=Fonticula alba TaxID=691883 RepID=A0A058Z297_FONAL|nr:hypothetical protein H696_05929 [Fonticula alba]KCV67642.1 hypothetical protein H696_05929 [Fonticula alba]|eukprot:XP_009497980.1 hypothetical protein H696_05929 [Fonticula alba]
MPPPTALLAMPDAGGSLAGLSGTPFGPQSTRPLFDPFSLFQTQMQGVRVHLDDPAFGPEGVAALHTADEPFIYAALVFHAAGAAGAPESPGLLPDGPAHFAHSLDLLAPPSLCASRAPLHAAYCPFDRVHPDLLGTFSEPVLGFLHERLLGATPSGRPCVVAGSASVDVDSNSIYWPIERRALLSNTHGVQHMSFFLGVSPSTDEPLQVYHFPVDFATLSLHQGPWPAEGSDAPGTSAPPHSEVPLPGGLAADLAPPLASEALAEAGPFPFQMVPAEPASLPATVRVCSLHPRSLLLVSQFRLYGAQPSGDPALAPELRLLAMSTGASGLDEPEMLINLAGDTFVTEAPQSSPDASPAPSPEPPSDQDYPTASRSLGLHTSLSSDSFVEVAQDAGPGPSLALFQRHFDSDDHVHDTSLSWRLIGLCRLVRHFNARMDALERKRRSLDPLLGIPASGPPLSPSSRGDARPANECIEGPSRFLAESVESVVLPDPGAAACMDALLTAALRRQRAAERLQRLTRHRDTLRAKVAAKRQQIQQLRDLQEADAATSALLAARNIHAESGILSVRSLAVEQFRLLSARRASLLEELLRIFPVAVHADPGDLVSRSPSIRLFNRLASGTFSSSRASAVLKHDSVGPFTLSPLFDHQASTSKEDPNPHPALWLALHLASLVLAYSAIPEAHLANGPLFMDLARVLRPSFGSGPTTPSSSRPGSFSGQLPAQPAPTLSRYSYASSSSFSLSHSPPLSRTPSLRAATPGAAGAGGTATATPGGLSPMAHVSGLNTPYYLFLQRLLSAVHLASNQALTLIPSKPLAGLLSWIRHQMDLCALDEDTPDGAPRQFYSYRPMSLANVEFYSRRAPPSMARDGGQSPERTLDASIGAPAGEAGRSGAAELGGSEEIPAPGTPTSDKEDSPTQAEAASPAPVVPPAGRCPDALLAQ